MTQRKKSCILCSNRLLTYCQAQEGVIHYESYRRQCLLVLIAMCSATSLGILTNTAGLYGLTTAGSVMVTRDLFGLQSYGGVYPTVSMGIAVANAVGSSVIVFLYDASGSYGIAIGLLLAMMASVTLLILRMYRRDGHSVLSKQY